jgi:hypothetical protein
MMSDKGCPMTTTFLSAADISGFKRWSSSRALPGNQDNDPAGGSTPVALALPAVDEPVAAAAEQRHRPWLLQGMKATL